MIVYEGIRGGHETALLSPERRYGRLDVIITVHPRRDCLYRQRSCGGLKRAQVIQAAAGRGVRVEHDCRPRDARGNRLEER